MQHQLPRHITRYLDKYLSPIKSYRINSYYSGLYAKRKCGADFVYQVSGSDKTQAKINDTIPPHLNRYGDISIREYTDAII